MTYQHDQLSHRCPVWELAAVAWRIDASSKSERCTRRVCKKMCVGASAGGDLNAVVRSLVVLLLDHVTDYTLTGV
jgi:hypothetical protein